MTKRMLIDATHAEETRVAVVDGNRLVEFDYESRVRKQLKGSIFLAKVTRVEPSLQASFVNFGGNRHGFLPFSEIHPDYFRIPIADREALLAEQKAMMEAIAAEEAAADAAEEAALAAAGKLEAPSSDVAPTIEEVEDNISTEEVGGKTAEVSAAAAAQAQERFEETFAPHESEESVESDDSEDDEPEESEGDNDNEASSDDQSDDESDDSDDDDSDESDDSENENASSEENGEEGSEESAAATSNEEAVPGEDNQAEGGEGRRDGKGRGRNNRRFRGRRGRNNGGRRSALQSRRVEIVGGDSAEGSDQPFRPNLRKNYKIQEVIKRGQIMLVQVQKEERGNKGAAVTTYLSLPGRYCVLMPNSPRGGGVSRKIASFAERKRMREILSELSVPDGMSVILRTAGVARTKVEIKRDLDYLMRLWDEIREQTLQSTAPAVIYEESNLVKRAVRDIYASDIEEIWASGEESFKEARNFMKMLMPSHIKRVQQYQDEKIPLFHRYQVESQIAEIGEPVVTLRSGGYLVINPTEALVSVDVNSGRATKERHIEETALKTNLEAAEEVARQLRLRDLGGLVVIDFIDMEDYRNNAKVERRLKEALSTDRARIQVGRISSFGLLELSRQRLNPSLTEAQFEKCPHCKAVGVVRTTDSAAITALRALEDEGIRNRASQIFLSVANPVALYILNQKRELLADIERRYGTPVFIRVDDSLAPAGYKIEPVKIAQSDDEDEDGEEQQSRPARHNNRDRDRNNNRDGGRDHGRHRHPRRDEQSEESVERHDEVIEASDDAGDEEDNIGNRADVAEDATSYESDRETREGGSREGQGRGDRNRPRRNRRGRGGRNREGGGRDGAPREGGHREGAGPRPDRPDRDNNRNNNRDRNRNHQTPRHHDEAPQGGDRESAAPVASAAPSKPQFKAKTFGSRRASSPDAQQKAQPEQQAVNASHSSSNQDFSGSLNDDGTKKKGWWNKLIE